MNNGRAGPRRVRVATSDAVLGPKMERDGFEEELYD
jgi:hypothetical protein